MKKIVTEVENEGMVSLLGKKVVLFCMNYFYTGILEGVNDSCVLLKDAQIIYETGPFTDKKWKDVQSMPTKGTYVQLAAIESFGEVAW